MKTYREFCLLAEAASTASVRDINFRIRNLQDKLRRTPNTPQYSKRRGTLKRAIDDLQRKKQHLQSKKEQASINKAASNIRKYTPALIRSAANRTRSFAKYTGAGMALGAIGLE